MTISLHKTYAPVRTSMHNFSFLAEFQIAFSFSFLPISKEQNFVHMFSLVPICNNFRLNQRKKSTNQNKFKKRISPNQLSADLNAFKEN
jgi:hypothetical protein